MNKNFKKYLINKGLTLYTKNNQPSTIFDYINGVKMVCKWEQKTIDELANSISEIYPKYVGMGECRVKGRMKSRAVRCGLRQFNDFVLNTKIA